MFEYGKNNNDYCDGAKLNKIKWLKKLYLLQRLSIFDTHFWFIW